LRVKPPAARWAAVPMVILSAATLIDDIGNFRWFWPYDKDAPTVALVVALLWYLIFGKQLHAWMAEVRAERDREDYPDEFKD